MSLQTELDQAAARAIDWKTVVGVAGILPRLVDDLPDSPTKVELEAEVRRLREAVNKEIVIRA